ncbi:MAG: metallophosphoesterase family protein [Lachnospiraceae bacterium]|nr:metallophosphoesterase family protein [Lachnospiraceae bacterium]
MRYYIADCHFFHEALLTEMDCRGFPSVEEMNEHMIAKWNDRVRARDEVVILGDLSVGSAVQSNALLDRLNGHLFLIRGNHDYFGKNRQYRTDRFEWIRDYTELNDNNRKVILCHYPIMFYNGQYRVRYPKTGGMDQIEGGGFCEQAVSRDELPRTTWMLYGHVHNTVDEELMNRFIVATAGTERIDRKGQSYHIPCQMINCFCMFSDYVPLSLDEWIENDRTRRTMSSAAVGNS